jgi:membrane protease YdiL (CAAX protease family)
MKGPTNTPIERIFRAPGAAWLLFAFGITFAPFFEEMFFRGFLLPAMSTVADWTNESLFARPKLKISGVSRTFSSIFAMLFVCSVAVAVPTVMILSIWQMIFLSGKHASLNFFAAASLGAVVYFGLHLIRPSEAESLVRPLAENGHPQWSFSAMAVASVVTSIPFAWLHAAQTGHSIGPLLLLFCVSLVLCAVRLNTRSLAASVTVHACYNFLLFSIMLAGTDGFRHLDKM